MYALYFPDSGAYTKLMSLPKAKALARQFLAAYIVDHNGIAI